MNKQIQYTTYAYDPPLHKRCHMVIDVYKGNNEWGLELLRDLGLHPCLSTSILYI